VGNPPHRLRRYVHDTRYRGRGLARRQLFQGDGSEHHTNLLDARSKDLSDVLLILPGYLKLDGAS
jgi:hypothetical protein